MSQNCCRPAAATIAWNGFYRSRSAPQADPERSSWTTSAIPAFSGEAKLSEQASDVISVHAFKVSLRMGSLLLSPHHFALRHEVHVAFQFPLQPSRSPSPQRTSRGWALDVAQRPHIPHQTLLTSHLRPTSEQLHRPLRRLRTQRLHHHSPRLLQGTT